LGLCIGLGGLGFVDKEILKPVRPLNLDGAPLVAFLFAGIARRAVGFGPPTATSVTRKGLAVGIGMRDVPFRTIGDKSGMTHPLVTVVANDKMGLGQFDVLPAAIAGERRFVWDRHKVTRVGL
jgi:hypothetical protein